MAKKEWAKPEVEYNAVQIKSNGKVWQNSESPKVFELQIINPRTDEVINEAGDIVEFTDENGEHLFFIDCQSEKGVLTFYSNKFTPIVSYSNTMEIKIKGVMVKK